MAPVAQPGLPQNQENTKVNYPIGLLRTVAAQILVDAGQALLDLQTQRQAAQSYLQTVPGLLYEAVWAFLQHHYERVNASYQWQLDFASVLFDVAQIIEDAERGIMDSFNYQNGSVVNGDSGNGNAGPRPTHGPVANV